MALRSSEPSAESWSDDAWEWWLKVESDAESVDMALSGVGLRSVLEPSVIDGWVG